MNSKTLVIPGNPPALHFYNSWKRELESDYNLRIAIADYPELDLSQKSALYMERIESHLSEHVERVNRLGSEKINLMGHSIGSHFALKLLARHPNKIDKCFLLFPFLQSPSSVGKNILILAHYMRKHFGVGSAKVLKKPFSFLFPELNRITDTELRAGFNLAFHEHNTIGKQKLLFELDSKLKSRVKVIYCKNDIWCPGGTVSNLKKSFDCLETNAKHSFVVNQKGRDNISRIIAKHL